ncbi:hypothetical protein FRC10_002132, partial [Ceratobasidium sp. 414]
MKPELLNGFFESFDRTKCIAKLKSEHANIITSIIALGFVRLVLSTRSREEDAQAEADLSELPEYRALLLKAMETDAYEEVEQ